MAGKIVPLKHQRANQVIQSEWRHQCSAIERTLNFFEEYFLWSTQQFELIDIESLEGSSPECLKFFHAEAPIVLEEARDTIKLLLMLRTQEAQGEAGL
jgi:hypothetical protein